MVLLHALPIGTPISLSPFQVERIQKTVVEWQSQVTAFRQKYPWLLFFSVPKALYLYSLLNKDLKLNLDLIVLEVSFLFENNITAQNILKKIVKVLNRHTWLLMKGDFICSFSECY